MKFQSFFFNQTPLNIAIEKENIEIIKILLTRNDIDVNEKSNIIKPIFFVYNVIIKKFIDKTPLYLASEIGNPEIVQLLLSCEEIDINLISIYIYYFIHTVFIQKHFYKVLIKTFF